MDGLEVLQCEAMFLELETRIAACTGDGLPLIINVDHLVHELEADQLGQVSAIPLGDPSGLSLRCSLRGGERADEGRDVGASPS